MSNGYYSNKIELTPESQLKYVSFCFPKMMTRREKLLVRPWQLRRYNNHKKKVYNATPIIDFGPPPPRKHVEVKLKKLQQEKERQMKIEEDNFKLLQHLGSIMKRKRVDNYWETKPPTFLRRVGIYHRTRTPTPCEETTLVTTPEPCTTRKLKCVACTPYPEPPVNLPEERIPWEAPKKILSRRRNTSAVPEKSDFDLPQIKHIRVEEVRKPVKETKKKKSPSSQNLGFPTVIQEKNWSKVEGAEQRIVVCQGPIRIVVNYPSFAEVKLIGKGNEKYLQRNYCECKSFRAHKKATSQVVQKKLFEAAGSH